MCIGNREGVFAIAQPDLQLIEGREGDKAVWQSRRVGELCLPQLTGARIGLAAIVDEQFTVRRLPFEDQVPADLIDRRTRNRAHSSRNTTHVDLV